MRRFSQFNPQHHVCAGGASRYVCIYDAVERVMLRRFSITANRSLDGVLDTLNSRC